MNNEQQKLVELAVRADTPPSRLKTALQVLQGEEQKPKGEGFLSVKDAMVFLGGISRVHLWQCRSKKGLPSYTVGGRIVFSRKELSDWVMKGSKA